MSHIQSGKNVLDAYNVWAQTYDDQINSLVALQDISLPQFLGNVKGLSVCDIGCGTGRNAHSLALSGAHVSGVDFSEGMLAKARERCGDNRNVQFIKHDLNEQLPFGVSSFDMVLCALVLEHVANLQRIFLEFNRICKPSGTILISALHPNAFVPPTMRSREASIEIKAYNHSVRDYHASAQSGGLICIEENNCCVDSGFVEAVPRASRYMNKNLLLLLKFIKR